MATKKTTSVAEEKATVKKTTSRRAATPQVYIQYMGNEFNQKEIVDRIVERYVSEGNKKSSIQSFEVYIKPEDNTAYYVINGQGDSISL